MKTVVAAVSSTTLPCENGGGRGGREQDAGTEASRRGGGGRRHQPPPPRPLRQGVPAALPRITASSFFFFPSRRNPLVRFMPASAYLLAWFCAPQEGIRKGVDLLRRCDEMVTKLGLFSPNETKDDVSTANLRYLLVPYYLGEMTEEIAQEDQIPILKASQDHLKQFIALCEVLELIPEDELELSRQRQPDTMANRRAQKVALFKRQKAAETKLQEIKERKERRGRSLRAAALSAPIETREEDALEDDGEEERELGPCKPNWTNSLF